MRRNARSWVVSVVLVFICFSLAFFLGGGGQIGAGSSPLVTVGNQEITVSDYQFVRARNESFYREQYGDRLTPELLRALDLPSLSLNQLVNGAVLRNEATRLGLTVPDETLRWEIREIQAFHGPAGFSPASYKAVLRRQGLTATQFEQQMREELLVEQLEDIIRRGVHLTEDEAFEEYREQNDKIVLSYLEIDGATLEDSVEINDAGLQSFFDQSGEQYRRAESVKIAYLAYTPEAFTDTTAVSDEEIDEYYYLNADEEFTIEEQVGARHILKKFDADDEETQTAARKAIEEVKAKLDGGADFESLAREESEDLGSGKAGGDLGLFARGAMVKSFEEAAFSLEKGQISDIIESRFGYHILQTYDRVAGGKRTLEEVRSEIATTLAQSDAVDAAFGAAAEDALTIRDGTPMKTVADSRDARIETTPFVTSSDALPEIGRAPAIVDAAIALGDGESASDPVRVGDSYYVVSVAERKESYIPPLADVRDLIEKAYRKEQAGELARTKADGLVERLKQKTTIEDLAKSEGLESKETAAFAKPGKFVPDIGTAAGLKGLAFATKVDGEVIPRSFLVRGKAYAFVRKSREEAGRETFDEIKEDRVESLRLQREQEAINEFLRGLKESTQISFDQSQIEQFVR